ncbi:hypothetical protein F5879DRAFT_994858 [Lentinula edodes]|nr:hypothetical protein F5879DRAFT_994858 [Lentinula edodes]
MKMITGYLSRTSSFTARYTIFERQWPRVLQWIVAVLRTLDAYKDPQRSITQDLIERWSQCLDTVFAFLDVLLRGPSLRPHDDTCAFIGLLEQSPEFIDAIAQVWILALILPQDLRIHGQVVDFLIWFGGALSSNSVGRDAAPLSTLYKAVHDLCPSLSGRSIYYTWLDALDEFCSWHPSSYCQSLSQGHLLAVTGLKLSRPLLTLDKSGFLVERMANLWSHQVCTSSLYNERGEALSSTSVQSCAEFFLQLTTGGPTWIVNALGVDLLFLVAKTLVWLSPPATCASISIDIVNGHSELRNILLRTVCTVAKHAIHRIHVARQACRNIVKVMRQIDDFEDYLPTGAFTTTWALLANEVMDTDIKFMRWICHRKSQEFCCNKTCPRITPTSQLCGGCRSASYCSKVCQKLDWLAGHRSLCRSFRNNQSVHSLSAPNFNDGKGPGHEQERMYFLCRAILDIKSNRGHDIRRCISIKGLESSRIMIELDMSTYPWALSVDLITEMPPIPDQKELPEEHDTFLGIVAPWSHQPCNDLLVTYPVVRLTLLDDAHPIMDRLSNITDYLYYS